MVEIRKLAAVMAADIVGFSRLAHADEDGTLARLRVLRSELIDPSVSRNSGRVFKRTGDGVIVEFRSVVDAVKCATEIQIGMRERNALEPALPSLEFRIGVHLGDIVQEEDGDLMGDGVNIAARLEGLARPGAIYLSEDAYRQVRNRVDFAVTDLGPSRLKNIDDPIRVFALQPAIPAQDDTSAKSRRRLGRYAFYVAPALIVIVAFGWRVLGIGSGTLSEVELDRLVRVADAEFDSKAYEDAAAAYRKAAEAGDARAQARLSAIFQQGLGTKADYAAARHWAELSAEKGNARGETSLGFLYYQGLGVPRDIEKARTWLMKGAAGGNASAQYAVGSLYDYGNGVSRDYKVALSWYAKAADQKYGRAEGRLGDMYRWALGVDQNLAAARDWYTRATEHGEPGGYNGLGNLYENGEGVDVDYGLAKSMYEKAADGGYLDAEVNLGLLYQQGLGVVRDETIARQWFEKAAAQNFTRAQIALGDLYRNGLGVPRDTTLAAQWYRRAADGGDSWGQVSLGYLYAKGDGVPKDCENARKLFAEAVTAENPAALAWIKDNSDCPPN